MSTPKLCGGEETLIRMPRQAHVHVGSPDFVNQGSTACTSAAGIQAQKRTLKDNKIVHGTAKGNLISRGPGMQCQKLLKPNNVLCKQDANMGRPSARIEAGVSFAKRPTPSSCSNLSQPLLKTPGLPGHSGSEGLKSCQVRCRKATTTASLIFRCWIRAARFRDFGRPTRMWMAL